LGADTVGEAQRAMATIARDVIIVSIEKLSTIFVSWIIYPLAASPRWKNRPADQ
jgi:hypothetical protein